MDAPPALVRHPRGASANTRFRQLVLALIAVSAAGLLAELLLLGHVEDVLQWPPVASLVLVLLLVALMAVRPSRLLLRVFQAVMTACLVLGAIGVFLHLKGNVEFELELKPTLAGWPLYWEALRGAVPALSPGALAQVGLLGLLYSHRHPVAVRGAGARPSPHQEST